MLIILALASLIPVLIGLLNLLNLQSSPLSPTAAAALAKALAYMERIRARAQALGVAPETPADEADNWRRLSEE